MEIQAEAEFIEVKSPIDRFKEQWANQPGKLNFFRQRNFLLENADLVQYAELAGAKGWTQPLRFALLGLLLAALALSAISWIATRDEGTYANQIASVRAELESEIKTEQGVIDASQFEMARVEKSRRNNGFTVASSKNLTREDALAQLHVLIEEARKLQQESQYLAEIKMQNLRAAGDGIALAASGTPVVVSLALLFAAPLFRKLMQNSYTHFRPGQDADTYYLYYVVSHGIWLNCALVVLLHLFLSRSAYGLSGLFEAIGPVGRILLWLALYALLLYWFFLVSKDMYKAMQLKPPRDYAGPENKVLLHMHNSFWLVLVVFEAALGVLAYAVYLLEKAS